MNSKRRVVARKSNPVTLHLTFERRRLGWFRRYVTGRPTRGEVGFIGAVSLVTVLVCFVRAVRAGGASLGLDGGEFGGVGGRGDGQTIYEG